MHVVITGASRGIGHALAELYQTRGAQVTGSSRAGGNGLLPLDVSDAGAFAGFGAALGGQTVDLLVCNAGIYPDKGQNMADGYPAQMWADTFATNVTGVFLTIQSLLPNLQLSQSPKIAIISSQMASDTRAPGGSYIYRASKAAVLNLGRNLAVDLRPLDIAVGIYHPGWVQTDMGGSAADITVDQAAQGLAARFDALDMADSGCFRTWAGDEHPF